MTIVVYKNNVEWIVPCVKIAGYYNSDERFINRGKVTDIKIIKEE